MLIFIKTELFDQSKFICTRNSAFRHSTLVRFCFFPKHIKNPYSQSIVLPISFSKYSPVFPLSIYHVPFHWFSDCKPSLDWSGLDGTINLNHATIFHGPWPFLTSRCIFCEKFIESLVSSHLFVPFWSAVYSFIDYFLFYIFSQFPLVNGLSYSISLNTTSARAFFLSTMIHNYNIFRLFQCFVLWT